MAWVFDRYAEPYSELYGFAERSASGSARAVGRIAARAAMGMAATVYLRASAQRCNAACTNGVPTTVRGASKTNC